MPLTWIHEDTPIWDARKAAVVGGAPAGIFDLPTFAEGALAPGEWFRVEDGGVVAGYGWMDCTWGDAEILLAVAPESQSRGVGEFILDHLEKEAAVRGLNYLYNTVRRTHPDRDGVTAWLESRGFQPSGDGLLKRRVRRA
jgi:GNAT superfamily N-acetyltransferase